MCTAKLRTSNDCGSQQLISRIFLNSSRWVDVRLTWLKSMSDVPPSACKQGQRDQRVQLRQFWREFFEAQTAVAEAEQKGLPTEASKNVCKNVPVRDLSAQGWIAGGALSAP